MIPYILIFYLLALIVAVATFKKYFDTPLRFFPLLIAYTLFNEILGYFVLHFEEFSFFDSPEYSWHNVIIYNIYKLFFFGYLLWLYFKLFWKKSHKNLVRSFALLLGLGYAISLVFQDPFHTDLFYADSLACVFMITLILIHFKNLLESNGSQPSRYNLMVWFGLGMLVFHLYFPFYLLNGYLNVDFFLDYQLRQVLWVIVCIMYGLFSIGFLISKRRAFR
ncbi:MAG: hypothetical protein ED555_07855 [Allomuricauda sp.]|nr:MAG: hypothetical protein ED555_07855 [Allomuricauda sp.]